MMSIVRSALVALALYFAVTYYIDDPDAFKTDVESLHEVAGSLPEVRERLVAGAEAVEAKSSETIFDAKNRLDIVKGRVQDSIALGSERISRAD